MLARWQEFVGTGELLRSLESRVGWARDRVAGWFRGKPQQVERGCIERVRDDLLVSGQRVSTLSSRTGSVPNFLNSRYKY